MMSRVMYTVAVCRSFDLRGSVSDHPHSSSFVSSLKTISVWSKRFFLLYSLLPHLSSFISLLHPNQHVVDPPSTLSLFLPSTAAKAGPPPPCPSQSSGGGLLPTAPRHHLADPRTTVSNSTSSDLARPRCLAGRRAGLHPPRQLLLAGGGLPSAVPASTRCVRCS
jgi:hypothetical protein